MPKHGSFNEVETLLPPAIEIETSCEDVTESDTNRNKEVDEKTKAAMQVKPPQFALGNSSLANTITTSSSFQVGEFTGTMNGAVTLLSVLYLNEVPLLVIFYGANGIERPVINLPRFRIVWRFFYLCFSERGKEGA